MQSRTRLWSALEALPSGEAVTAAWRHELGGEFEAVLPLLRPTGKLARSYPCPARPPCGCEHRVISQASGRIVAVCQCADGAGCERVVLEPGDVVVMGLDVIRLGAEVARALKLGPVVGNGRDGAVKAQRIGSEGPLRSPVYLLVPEDPADALQRVNELMRVESEPFFLLTPGDKCMTAEVRAALARHGCTHACLDGLLEVRAGGQLAAVGSIDGLRAEFARRLAEGPKAQTEELKAEMRKLLAEAMKYSAVAQPPINQGEAQRIFAVLQRLRSKRAGMMAPLYDVFVATVLEGRAQRAAAKCCGCSPALLSKRVGELEKEFGLALKQLQNYAKPLLEMETSVKGQRYARKRRGAPADEAGQYDEDDGETAAEDDNGYLPEERLDPNP